MKRGLSALQRVAGSLFMSSNVSGVYDLFSFKYLIQEPTSFSLTTSSLIDHIATTCPNNFVDSGVLQVSMSDHYLVYCFRNLNGARRKDYKEIKTRSMKNLNETAFLIAVSQIIWDRIVSRPIDINVLVDNWCNLFSMIIDKHVPIRSMRVSEDTVHGLARILRDSSGREVN